MRNFLPAKISSLKVFGGAYIRDFTVFTVHEITVSHRSLSGTISCVTDRIRFLPVTMTGRFSNFNSISYTEDRQELRVTGTKYRLPDTMSGIGEMFISGAELASHPCNLIT